jgi:PAS domain S-box-containing protein
MTLRRTAVLIVCLTFLSLFAALYAFSSSILRGSFDNLEREEVEEETTRAVRALQGEWKNLEATAADWGMWDDTYRFVAERGADYLRLNVNAQSLETIRVDLVLLYDAANRPVLGQILEAKDQTLTDAPASLADKVAATPLARRAAEAGRPVSGLLVEAGTVWLLAACPVLTSVREGPSRGTLVMGRRLDADNIARLGERIMLDVGVVDLQVPGLPPRVTDIAAALTRSGRILLAPDGDKRIQGVTLLRDLDDKPAILLSVTMPRRILEQGRLAQRNNVVFLLVVGLAFGLAMLYLVERRILSRVTLLRNQIGRLGAEPGALTRTDIAGHDEIAALSQAINAMLAALDKAHGRYALATRAAKVGVWEYWPETGAYYIDPGFLRLLGDEEADTGPGLDGWLERVHPEDRERVRREMTAWIDGQGDAYVGNQRLAARDGTVRWVLVRGQAVRDAAGRRARFVGTNTDVTELMQAEESIRELTGALIAAQETERGRIARDLHDNVAQDLSAAKISSQTLLDGAILASPGVEARLSGFTDLLSRAIRSVREISYDLRPPDLEYLGLVKSLERLCDDFIRRTGIMVDFAASGLDGVEVAPEVAINLYRIVQEALANVRRHAEARHVSVRLVESFPKLIVRIKDDGRGFDVAAGLARASHRRRMGLASMRERVGLFGGKLRIVSKPGQGCLVAAEVVYLAEADHGHETGAAD